MRINELNMFQKFLGRGNSGKPAGDTSGVGSALFRSRKSGLSAEDQLAQDTFIKRFVSRGMNALNTAVQQGLVDVNSDDLGASKSDSGKQEPAAPAAGSDSRAGGQGAAPGGAAPAAAPAAGSQAGGAAPAAPNKAAQAGGKPQVDVNVDTAIKAMRTLQPSGTKKLPEKNAAELNKTLQYVSKNKDYLLIAADKINKFNSAGYDMKPFHNTFMQQFALGKKQKTIQEERLLEILNKLLTEASFRMVVAKRGYDPNLVTQRITKLLNEAGETDRPESNLQSKPGINPVTGKPFAKAGGQQPAQAPAKKPAAAPAKAATPAKKPIDKAKAMKRNPGDFAKTAGTKQPVSPQQAPANAAAASPAAASPAGSDNKASDQAPSGTADAGNKSAGGKPSAGAWFRDNFMKGFLRGINLGSSQSQVDDILKRMGKSVNAGTINKDINDIAQIAWAVSDQGRKVDTDPNKK